jgi:hypothetical protein
LFDALGRLARALGRLRSGPGSSAPQSGGADLMPVVMTMQAYWVAYLRERQQALLDGAGLPGRGMHSDAASLTDLDAFLASPDGGGPPEATLADLDEFLESPPDGPPHHPAAPPDAEDEGPPSDVDALLTGGTGEDPLADVDALLTGGTGEDPLADVDDYFDLPPGS